MPKSTGKPNGRKWLLPLATFVVGVFAVVGAQAALKSTDEASFCGSCHVMSEAVWTHKMSVHAKQACNECHLPYNLASRLPYKAALGMGDVFTNTFGNTADVIHASQNMKDVIQENCRRCHYPTTMEVNMTVKPYCTDCHRSVPHMNKLPIDRRMAADV